MSLCFGSSQPDRDEPAELEWPPVFEAYEDYKADLDAAIKSHPPFGEWLRRYRNVNSLTTVGDKPMCWHMSVEELKERYVKTETIRMRTKNAKRAIAEVHLEVNAQEYQAAQDDYDAKQESYKVVVEKYNEAKKHGNKYVSRPNEPQLSNALRHKAELERIILL